MNDEVEKLCAVWEWVLEFRKMLKREPSLQSIAERFDSELTKYTKRSEPPYALFRQCMNTEPTFEWITHFADSLKNGVTIWVTGEKDNRYIVNVVEALRRIIAKTRCKNIVLEHFPNETTVLLAYMSHQETGPTLHGYPLKHDISARVESLSRLDLMHANIKDRVISILQSDKVTNGLLNGTTGKRPGPKNAAVIAVSLLFGLSDSTVWGILRKHGGTHIWTK